MRLLYRGCEMLLSNSSGSESEKSKKKSFQTFLICSGHGLKVNASSWLMLSN
jgi:hypothetical protein